MSKSAKRIAAGNLYYFDKKTKKLQLTYDQAKRASKFITRANDRSKTIGNKQGKFLLTDLAQRLISSKEGVIFIDHDYISSITDCLPEQNTKILGQLADIFDYQYHRSIIFEGRRKHYGLIVKFTHDGEKRLINPELFYDIDYPQKQQKITVGTPKKIDVIAEKNRSSYIDIRDKEEKEEAKAYSSFSSSIPSKGSTPLACAREAEIVQISQASFEETPQAKITEIPTLATGYPTEPAKVYQTEEIRSEASEVVTNCHRLGEISLLQDIPLLADLLSPNEERPTVEESSTVTPKTIEPDKNVGFPKYQEVTPMKNNPIPIEPERNMEFELSGAIFKSFGGVKSDEIMENCKFILINENKLGVQINNGFSLTLTDRDRLKACIHLVYGDNINIVSSSVVKIAQPETKILEKPRIESNYQKWNQFRKDLLNYLPEKMGQHILCHWFDKLLVSEDRANNRIILTGSRFYVDSVYNRFQSAIEHVVTKNKVTLELHFENNDEKPIIYKPNGGF